MGYRDIENRWFSGMQRMSDKCYENATIISMVISNGWLDDDPEKLKFIIEKFKKASQVVEMCEEKLRNGEVK